VRLPVTPATTLWRELRDEVRLHYRAGRVVLAVDGLPGAATSTFADGFAEVFAETGAAVFRASMDGFQRPQSEREARGRESAEGRYRDAYDYGTFRRVLRDPFREGAQTGGATGFQLASFDAERDIPLEAHWVTAPRDAVLIVDGGYLLRPELRGLWNWSVWLDAPARFDSAPQRDAAALYLNDADPRHAASAIVDDTDPAHPVRIYGDFC
jgi:uridine kinase